MFSTLPKYEAVNLSLEVKIPEKIMMPHLNQKFDSRIIEITY
jgi:hypothetical protein